MEKTRKFPYCLIVFLIYVLTLLLVSMIVVGLDLGHGIVYLFTTPCILSPFYFQRRLYFSMILLLSVDLVWVASRVSNDFQVTLTNIIIVMVSSIILAETIHHLSVSREQAAQALQESERRLGTLMANLPGMAYRCLNDPDWTMEFISSGCLALTGYASSELMGNQRQSYGELIHPEDREFVWEEVQLALANQRLFEMEYRISTADGGQKVVWEKGTGIYEGERLLFLEGFIADITDRKQAEEAMRANEEKYRALFEHLPIPAFTKNREGEYTSCNAENRRYWMTNLVGRTDAELLNPETAAALRGGDLRVMETGETLTREEYLVDTPLGERQFLSRKVPLRDGRGNIVGILGASLDITERQHAEEERLKLKKLESVGALAGGIAHDFNNLLTGVFGNIEMAKMFLSADHKSHKFLESAWRSMESATRLTQQLLTFAKGGDPIKETLFIGAVITETAQFSIRGSRAKLHSNIAPDLWLVEADKGQLSQVVSNLVINAQQAMPVGGAITIAAENIETPEGRYVQITVQDEGIGIAPQHLNNIFDPYFTTKQEGNGLGLATTYSIISKHGGTISVDSQLGQGTTFIIRLPASEKEEEKATGEPIDATDPAPVAAARILVLDDDEVIRKVLGAMLESMGYKVAFAVDGREAIAKYRAAYEKGALYDVVITDLTIPGGMGGQDVAREILEIYPQAKIIISSGYATDPVMANYEAYGFQAMVVKPFQFEHLQEVLQQVLKM